MDGQSLTPQAFHEDRLDWAKLQAALGKEILLREKSVDLDLKKEKAIVIGLVNTQLTHATLIA